MLYYAVVKEVHFKNDCFCIRKIQYFVHVTLVMRVLSLHFTTPKKVL